MNTTNAILDLLTLLLKRMFGTMKSSFLTFQSVIVYKYNFIWAKH